MSRFRWYRKWRGGVWVYVRRWHKASPDSEQFYSSVRSDWADVIVEDWRKDGAK